MTGNLLGEEFDPFVFEQIKKRQELMGSGFNDQSISPNQIQLLNNKNSFLRLASSVDLFSNHSVPQSLDGLSELDELKTLIKLEEDTGYIEAYRSSGRLPIFQQEDKEKYKSYREQIIQNNQLQTEIAKNKLRSIGFSENEIKRFKNKSELARSAVLWGGLSKINENIEGEIIISNFSQRKGIQYKNDVWNGSKAYGLGGPNFGKQPMPGITSATIECINRGSTRDATIQIKAYNTFQFQLLETLYLRLGFTMYLEWGHQKFLNNSGDLEEIGNTFLDNDFFQDNKKLSQNEALQLIQNYREEYSGNYDGFFGRVVNFSWTFNDQGVYDITLKLITLGDIVESIQMNIPANIKSFSSNNPWINAPSTMEVWLDNFINKDKSKNSVFQGGNYINLKSLNYTNRPRTETTEFKTLNDKGEEVKITGNFVEISKKLAEIKKKTKNVEAFEEDILQLNNIYTGKFQIQDGTTHENSYFVRFGTFLEKVYNNILPRVIGPKGNLPILNIEFDEEINVISAQPNQISFDLGVCFVKPMLFAPGILGRDGQASSTLQADSIKDYFILEKEGKIDVFYGKLMNLYLNFNFIKQCLNQSNNDSGVVDLFSFFSEICKGINSALGDVNKIEPIINAEKNTLVFIDQNPIKGNPQVLKKLLSYIPEPQEITPLEVFGFNTTGKTPISNFVKEFNFETKIDSSLATNITIGTTAGGSQSKVTDGTAFGNINSGLIDRFQKSIAPPPDFITEEQLIEISKLKEESEIRAELKEWWGDIVVTDVQRNIPGKLSTDRDLRNKQLGYREEEDGDFIRWAYLRTSSGVKDKNYVTINARNGSGNRKTGRYKGWNFENESLETAISGYIAWKKIQGKDVLDVTDIDFELSYQTWLVYAVGGVLAGKKDVDGQPFSIGLDEALYLNRDNTGFFSQGKAAFKEYLRKRDQKIFRVTGNPSNQGGFIPIELSLTVDGISGIKLFQRINVNNRFLPVEYQNFGTQALTFLVMTINHDLQDEKWITKITTLSIPPTQPDNIEAVDTGLFDYLVLDENETLSQSESNGNAQRYLPSQLVPSNNVRKKLKSSEAFRANAYKDPGTKNDPVKQGKPITIGYGQTYYTPGQQYTRNGVLQTQTGKSFVRRGDGKNEIKLGDQITQNSGNKGFNDIVNYTGQQMVKSGGWGQIPFTQNEFDALVHFNYNTGPFYGTKTPGKKKLYDLILAKDYTKAGEVLADTMVNAGGKPILRSRRNMESKLFLTNQPPNPA